MKSDVDYTPPDIANYWEQGIHIEADGTQINISDMPDKYIENVINKFSGIYDTTVLQEYLDDPSSVDFNQNG